MRKVMHALAILGAITLSLFLGTYVGYDMRGSEVRELQAYTNYLERRDDLLMEKLQLAGEQVTTFYDFDAGQIPAKEARETLSKLQKQVRQKNTEIDALNAELEAK